MITNNFTIEIDQASELRITAKLEYPNEPIHKVLRRLRIFLQEDMESNGEHKVETSTKIERSPAQPISSTQQSITAKVWAIIDHKKGINATGIELDGERIKVLKGAKFSKTEGSKFRGTYKQLRDDLRRQAILNERFELTQDYTFNAFSAGASVIHGTQCNKGPWERKE